MTEYSRTCLAAVALTSLATCSMTAAEEKPNFIIILTDDQGYQDLGCFGSPLIKTPNVDKLAANGMKFTDFYVSCSVCTPSRFSLQTGLYPQQGKWKSTVVFPQQNVTMFKEGQQTIADVLKAKGYATAAIGKWHLGHQKSEYLPTGHGYDYYYGIPYSNDMGGWKGMPFAKDVVFGKGNSKEVYDVSKRNGPPLMQNDKVIEYPVDQVTLTKRYTDEAVKFIKENKNKSFYLFVSHSMPHVPLYSGKDFQGKSKRGPYGDAIEEVDWSVGQIVKTLQENNLNSKTLILYTSDNGPWLNKKDHGGSALPLRDGKKSTWEGGPRVPTVISWPGHIPADKVCNKVASTMDVLPTFAKLAGAKLPNYPLDGHDISQMIFSPHTLSKLEYLFYTAARGQIDSIRHGKWKLHQNALYDLDQDIGEQKNLASKYPEVVSKLQKTLSTYQSKYKNNQPKRK